MYSDAILFHGFCAYPSETHWQFAGYSNDVACDVGSGFITIGSHQNAQEWKTTEMPFFDHIILHESQSDAMQKRSIARLSYLDHEIEKGVYYYSISDGGTGGTNDDDKDSCWSDSGDDNEITAIILSVILVIYAFLLVIRTLIYMVFYILCYTYCLILRVCFEGIGNKRLGILQERIHALQDLHPEYLSVNQINYLEENMNDWLFQQKEEGLIPPYITISIEKTKMKKGSVDIVTGVYFKFEVDTQHSYVFYPPKRFDDKVNLEHLKQRMEI